MDLKEMDRSRAILSFSSFNLSLFIRHCERLLERALVDTLMIFFLDSSGLKPTSQQASSNCLVPAVNNNGSGVKDGTLSAVDFLEEPENATGIVGDPVVRPAQVLVMPDVPQRLLLQKQQ